MEKTATGKQPYAIALANRKIMALAGLWGTWRSPAGERIRSFAIVIRAKLTSTANCAASAPTASPHMVQLASDAGHCWRPRRRRCSFDGLTKAY
jgi:hypothetical protein